MGVRPGRAVAFHLAYQLIDPYSVADERTLFARAVNSVIDGFVPADTYVRLASRRESDWRVHRSERDLEERARLLIDHSLNPVALAGKALPSVQALKAVSDMFFLNNAVAVKTRLNVVGDDVEITRDTFTAHALDDEDEPEPSLAWAHLSLCQDAVACLIDVTRQKVNEARVVASALPEGSPAPSRPNALLSLGRCLGQQGSAVFSLLEALEGDVALTPDGAARAMGCSSRTLQRHLQTMDLSLPRIRLATRLLRSLHLMAQGVSLSDTAAEAGFFDYPHFARTFRRSSGFLPTTYQRVLSVLDVPRFQMMV